MPWYAPVLIVLLGLGIWAIARVLSYHPPRHVCIGVDPLYEECLASSIYGPCPRYDCQGRCRVKRHCVCSCHLEEDPRG